MNTEVGGGSRALKSMTGLITTALVCVALGVACGAGAWLLGLDVLYVAAGVALLTRPSARLKGFGLAVVVQGAFLLALDVTFWLRAG